MEHQFTECISRNLPYRNYAFGRRCFLSLERIGPAQGRAEQRTSRQQTSGEFVAFGTDPGKLDLSTENAEEIVATFALCVDRNLVSERTYRCRWTVTLQILQRQAGEK